MDTEEYKLAVKYMALTEMYDRLVSFKRSNIDPTQAIITDTYWFRMSVLNSKKILDDLKVSKEIIREEIMKHRDYTAQHWIDEYYRIWFDGYADVRDIS